MSKLKCWKEIKKNVWKKERASVLEIRYDTILGGYDVILARGNAPSLEKFLNRKPKTKPEALAFAQKYMKNHDRC